MKRVITALVLIPLVLLLLLWGSFLWIVLVTGLVAALSAWEYLSIADGNGAKTPRILVLLSIAALFAGIYRDPSLTMSILGVCAVTLLVVCSFRSPIERVLPDTAYSVFGILYCGLTLAAIPLIWVHPNGPALVVFLLCVVWAGDIVALYVGRNLGRHKLAPRLSPGKTWEGSAGSLAGSVLIALALVALSRYSATFNFSRLGSQLTITGSRSYPGPLAWWLGLAIVLNLFAQVGDLVESAIKRGAGVKDSGTLLPGHGGILDRIDALLLAAPALWYAQWIQHHLQRVSLR